jgi:hypothetical protein
MPMQWMLANAWQLTVHLPWKGITTSENLSNPKSSPACTLKHKKFVSSRMSCHPEEAFANHYMIALVLAGDPKSNEPKLHLYARTAVCRGKSSNIISQVCVLISMFIGNSSGSGSSGRTKSTRLCRGG